MDQRRAVRKVLQESPEKFDPRDYLKPARAAMKDLCQARMVAFGQAGNAAKFAFGTRRVLGCLCPYNIASVTLAVPNSVRDFQSLKAFGEVDGEGGMHGALMATVVRWLRRIHHASVVVRAGRLSSHLSF